MRRRLQFGDYRLVRIDRPLLKLPIRFCADTLAGEVALLPIDAWMAHPQKFDGNSAVPLVSPGGVMTDEWAGPMGPTQFLRSCPYVIEVMQALDSTWGRSRLMALAPGSVVPEHVDIHYYWRTHLRIHIPVITSPQVSFTCAGETVHMYPGECWLLDSFYRHSVENCGSEDRVHLVLDTVGSARMWDLIDRGMSNDDDAAFVAPGSVAPAELQFEQINAPAIMSPWEMKSHFAYLAGWVDEGPRLERVMAILDRFLMAWSGTWARYGTSDEGVPHYFRHLQEVGDQVAAACRPPVLMRNGWGLFDSLRRYVFANAIAPAKLQGQANLGTGPQIRMTA